MAESDQPHVPGTPYPPALRDKARLLFISGVSLLAIAAALGVHYKTVEYWCSTGNWSDLRLNAKSRAMTAILKPGRADLRERAHVTRAKLADKIDRLAERIDVDSRDPGNSKNGEGAASILNRCIDGAAKVYAWGQDSTLGIVVMGDMHALEPASAPAASPAPGPIVDVDVDVDSYCGVDTPTCGMVVEREIDNTPQDSYCVD